MCARAGQCDGVCAVVCVSAFQRILINNKAVGGKETGSWRTPTEPKDKLRFVYVKQKLRIFQRTVTGFRFHFPPALQHPLPNRPKKKKKPKTSEADTMSLVRKRIRGWRPNQKERGAKAPATRCGLVVAVFHS